MRFTVKARGAAGFERTDVSFAVALALLTELSQNDRYDVVKILGEHDGKLYALSYSNGIDA